MAQGIVEFEHGKARFGRDLAFLVLATFLAMILASGEHERALAFVSPQSPVPPADQGRAFALPVMNVTGTVLGWLESVWRVRVGTGLIVLGVALVVGGLVWITDRGTPISPGPPDGPGEHTR
jgi:hypothetical protein